MGFWRTFWAALAGRVDDDCFDRDRDRDDDVLSTIQIDTAATRLAVNQLFRKIDNVKVALMSKADELAAAFDAATNEVASDLQAVKDALAAAIADQDQVVQDAVNAELAKLDAPLDRLRALGADPANPVPTPEPQPEPPVEGGDQPPAA